MLTFRTIKRSEIDRIVNDHLKPKPSLFIKERERLVVILELLFRAKHNSFEKNRKQIVEDETSSFSVSSIILHKHISRYKKYLEALEDGGIIKKTKSHSNGNSCIQYQFISGQSFEFFTVTEPKLVDRLVGDRTSAKLQYPELYEFFSELEVDMIKAEPILASLSKDCRRRAEQLLRRIQNKEVSVFRLGKTDRLYTPLTNLNRELKKGAVLKYKGKILVELDIKNSIPYVALYYIKNKIKEERKEGEEKGKVYILPKNYDHYVDLVCSGDLYPYLHCAWTGKNNPSRADIKAVSKGERDVAKKKILQLCNIPNSYKVKCKYWKTFSEHFQAVAHAIETINHTYHYTKKSRYHDPDECPYACKTQKLEAKCLLGLIVSQLISEGIKPIFTIHDSILTTEEHVDRVQSIMLEVLEREIGIKPTINKTLL